MSDIRKIIVLVGNEYSDISNKFLAEKLKLSPSMITKIISKESKATAYVNEVIKGWKG